MIKGWIKAVVSVLLTAALFLGAQRLVMPKYTGEVKEGGYVAEYYKEKLPHQVLMVGDCELYENFSPITMWREHGITSYIRGSAQQLVWQSYYLLKEALERETPEVVVFSVLALKYNEPQHEEYNRMTLDGMKWSRNKWDAISASVLEDENKIEYLFPILRFHSRVTELDKDDVTYLFKDIQRTTAGYYMRVDVDASDGIPWAEDIPEDYQFGERAMEYLDRIRLLCEEKGIPLVLIKAPSISPVWYDEWEQQVADYADKYNLDYINYLKLIDEIGIDYETDTYDQGLHMNLSGAEKCASYLGDYLADKYGLKNLSEDAETAEDWKEKERFYEDMKAAQKKELDTYGEILHY